MCLSHERHSKKILEDTFKLLTVFLRIQIINEKNVKVDKECSDYFTGFW